MIEDNLTCSNMSEIFYLTLCVNKQNIMIEKLACDCESAELMNYIFLTESLFLPEPTPFDVPFGSNGKIHKHKLTEEEREELMNRPLLYSECMDIFKDRYNSNAFLKKFTYEEYIKNKDIQNLVKHLELDADKFWLLILFIFDYCSSVFHTGKTIKLTAIQQLQNLVDIINYRGDDTMILNFACGKNKFKVDNPDAIRFIKDAIIDYSKRVDVQTLREINIKVEDEKFDSPSDTAFIAYFARMFLLFFCVQPQIVAKRKAGAKHSKKEMELVSLLVYFTKLSDNENWFCPEEKYLKAYLKQYKDKWHKFPNNISSIYPDFSF